MNPGRRCHPLTCALTVCALLTLEQAAPASATTMLIEIGERALVLQFGTQDNGMAHGNTAALLTACAYQGTRFEICVFERTVLPKSSRR